MFFLSRRAKFCKSFCMYQMSNAETLQSECTACWISESKVSQVQKQFRQ